MMRSISTLGLVAAFAAGCMPSVPPARMASTETAVKSAREAGADSVPDAKDHLRMAEDELAKAKSFNSKGDPQRAEAMLNRAESDAALAAALTDEARGKGALESRPSNVRAKQSREPSR